ncbi:DUF6476 family protein [Rubritepida flocculans]|uniref:DUF6476 family protein n=1 Tax=Rubritepida flocculans TaxID=182403 RepID=UPI00040C6200|nr:DUF6476 family protein [Rubritepida flocculans]
MQALKFLVVAMGVLIVAGTVTLIVFLVQRAGGREGAASLPPINLDLPPGSRILSVAGAGDRFAVLVQRPDGERVLFLDARSGRVVGQAFPQLAAPAR